MGKRARVKARATASVEATAGVGPRQPCPCGSGKRYKACHGASGGAWSARPFEGLAGECDLVALSQFVPAATAPLPVRDTDREVLIATLLPGAAPALVRDDGAVWLGLQVRHDYGDRSRDLAAVLTLALAAEPGTVVGLPADPGAGDRLQDLLVADAGPVVTVHEGFDFWVADVDDPDGSVAAALEQANGAVAPTVRLPGVEAAYWTRSGDREYLRWVLPEAEDDLLDAISRLHHAGADRLVDGDRLLGMFRSQGLLAPVWEVPAGTGAPALAAPAAAFRERLSTTLLDAAPLTSDERATRAGLAARQVTIR